MIFREPEGSSIMLPGLMSRWAMPWAWAATSPAVACHATPSPVARDRPTSERSISCRRVRPGTYSMVRYSSPRQEPNS